MTCFPSDVTRRCVRSDAQLPQMARTKRVIAVLTIPSSDFSRQITSGASEVFRKRVDLHPICKIGEAGHLTLEVKQISVRFAVIEETNQSRVA
jgi:hypothetical protein